MYKACSFLILHMIVCLCERMIQWMLCGFGLEECDAKPCMHLGVHIHSDAIGDMLLDIHVLGHWLWGGKWAFSATSIHAILCQVT